RRPRAPPGPRGPSRPSRRTACTRRPRCTPPGPGSPCLRRWLRSPAPRPGDHGARRVLAPVDPRSPEDFPVDIPQHRAYMQISKGHAPSDDARRPFRQSSAAENCPRMEGNPMRPSSRRLRVCLSTALLSILMAASSGGAGPEAGKCVVRPALDCPPCDDGNACTSDTCDPSTGTCGHAPIVCDDANPCTTDTCDPAIGCVFDPLSAGTSCDDGNACTAGDVCDDAARCAGTPEPSGT